VRAAHHRGYRLSVAKEVALRMERIRRRAAHLDSESAETEQFGEGLRRMEAQVVRRDDAPLTGRLDDLLLEQRNRSRSDKSHREDERIAPTQLVSQRPQGGVLAAVEDDLRMKPSRGLGRPIEVAELDILREGRPTEVQGHAANSRWICSAAGTPAGAPSRL